MDDPVFQAKLEYAGHLLSDILIKACVDDGHSFGHAQKVMGHAVEALKKEECLPLMRTAILFASLLHDADDEKFFGKTDNYPNARFILAKCNERFSEFELDVELVINMISLVSASKNKNSRVELGNEWMLIPRWCDRLEAIGHIGLVRAIDYAIHIGNPMITPETLPVYDDDDLEQVAPYSRFLTYNGKSASVIDHLYDKILHIGLRQEDTTNEYLLRISLQRTQIVKDFLFDGWANGWAGQTLEKR